MNDNARSELITSWYIPLDGDGHYAGTFEPEFAPTVERMTAVADAAETSGFDMVLIPTFLLNSAFGEGAPRADAITMATAIALATSKLRLLLAFKIGEIHPALVAKICASLDQMSGGRLAVNITSGAGGMEARFGEPLEHDARYRRTWETVTILNRLWNEDLVDFEGEFFRLEQAISEPKPITRPRPPFYTVGLSDIAKDMAAAEGDVHLVQCDAPDIVKSHVEDIRRRAAKLGRTVRFGIRAQLVVRDTEKEAWERLREMLSRVDPRVLASRQREYREISAVEAGKLVKEALNAHLIAPNVWNGMHNIKSGAGTVLVGSPAQIAERCLEYYKLGIDVFIFSSYLHVEEARIAGELFLPVSKDRIN